MIPALRVATVCLILCAGCKDAFHRDIDHVQKSLDICMALNMSGQAAKTLVCVKEVRPMVDRLSAESVHGTLEEAIANTMHAELDVAESNATLRSAVKP